MLTKLINNKRSFSPTIDYSNIPLLSLIKDSLTEKRLAFCLAYEYGIDGVLTQNQIYKFEKTYKKFKRELANSQTTFFCT